MTDKPLSKNLTIGTYGPISLSLTVGRLILAKKKDIDIANPDTGVLGQMFIDPIVLAENVWKIYGDRISKSGIETEEEFYELLDDSTNRELDIAFKNAVKDFFTWGTILVEHIESMIAGGAEVMEERAQELVDEVTEKGNSQSQEKPGSTSGSSQES